MSSYEPVKRSRSTDFLSHFKHPTPSSSIPFKASFDIAIKNPQLISPASSISSPPSKSNPVQDFSAQLDLFERIANANERCYRSSEHALRDLASSPCSTTSNGSSVKTLFKTPSTLKKMPSKFSLFSKPSIGNRDNNHHQPNSSTPSCVQLEQRSTICQLPTPENTPRQEDHDYELLSIVTTPESPINNTAARPHTPHNSINSRITSGVTPNSSSIRKPSREDTNSVPAATLHTKPSLWKLARWAAKRSDGKKSSNPATRIRTISHATNTTTSSDDHKLSYATYPDFVDANLDHTMMTLSDITNHSDYTSRQMKSSLVPQRSLSDDIDDCASDGSSVIDTLRCSTEETEHYPRMMPEHITQATHDLRNLLDEFSISEGDTMTCSFASSRVPSRRCHPSLLNSPKSFRSSPNRFSDVTQRLMDVTANKSVETCDTHPSSEENTSVTAVTSNHFAKMLKSEETIAVEQDITKTDKYSLGSPLASPTLGSSLNITNDFFPKDVIVKETEEIDFHFSPLKENNCAPSPSCESEITASSFLEHSSSEHSQNSMSNWASGSSEDSDEPSNRDSTGSFQSPRCVERPGLGDKMMNEIDGRVSLDPLGVSPGLISDENFRDVGFHSSLYAAAFSNQDCDDDDYRSSLSSHLDTSSFSSSLVSSPCPVRGKKTSINRYSCIFTSSASARSSICLGPRTPAGNPEEYFWPASLSPSAIRDSSGSVPRSTISSISQIASLYIADIHSGEEDNEENRGILASDDKLQASDVADSALREAPYATPDDPNEHFQYQSSQEIATAGENGEQNFDNSKLVGTQRYVRPLPKELNNNFKIEKPRRLESIDLTTLGGIIPPDTPPASSSGSSCKTVEDEIASNRPSLDSVGSPDSSSMKTYFEFRRQPPASRRQSGKMKASVINPTPIVEDAIKEEDSFLNNNSTESFGKTKSNSAMKEKNLQHIRERSQSSMDYGQSETSSSTLRASKSCKQSERTAKRMVYNLLQKEIEKEVTRSRSLWTDSEKSKHYVSDFGPPQRKRDILDFLANSRKKFKSALASSRNMDGANKFQHDNITSTPNSNAKTMTSELRQRTPDLSFVSNSSTTGCTTFLPTPSVLIDRNDNHKEFDTPRDDDHETSPLKGHNIYPSKSGRRRTSWRLHSRKRSSTSSISSCGSNGMTLSSGGVDFELASPILFQPNGVTMPVSVANAFMGTSIETPSRHEETEELIIKAATGSHGLTGRTSKRRKDALEAAMKKLEGHKKLDDAPGVLCEKNLNRAHIDTPQGSKNSFENDLKVTTDHEAQILEAGGDAQIISDKTIIQRPKRAGRRGTGLATRPSAAPILGSMR